MNRSKRYNEAIKLVDKTRYYKTAEAVKVIKEAAKTKFNESVDMVIILGIDAKKTDQTVRGTIMLPHGTGKTKAIAVVTKGEKVLEAKEAGADFVGSNDIIDDIEKNKIKFDVLVATPDMMKDLSRLAKTLGPKGLMPNPKTGTVTFELAGAIKRIKAGEVPFRNDESGVIHLVVGKVKFEEEKLVENVDSAIETILKAKPASAKGQYIKAISLSSTMGPGLKIVVPHI
jgi:large subunit ribosomal protein L1